MVSRAWTIANRDRALVPSLDENPTEATLERAGARRIMTEYFFVEPAVMPDGDTIVYSKIENHSNLYQMRLP
jgi:hypothetical protein